MTIAKGHFKGAAWLAGEASGDFLASLVLPEVKKAMSGVPQYGVGGEKMVASGLEAWWSNEPLSVMGYVEVIKNIPSILQLRRNVMKRCEEIRPDVFIGVDAPDFNLGIEKNLRRRGIRTVHMVSPSIWAWRPERIETIRAACDHVLLLFPFEQALYDSEGVSATYIGHPLAGLIPMKPDQEKGKRALKLKEGKGPIFAILPGSRIDEVKGCAPIFFKAADLILREIPEARFLVPASDIAKKESILRLLNEWPELKKATHVFLGQSHTVMQASDVVLAASGTATLEAALFKKPLVVGYTVPALSAWLMKRQGLIPYVSLPNILCQEMVVPEFLQYYCTPEVISQSLIDQLDSKRKEILAKRFTSLHEELLRPTAKLASDAIIKAIENSPF